MSAPATLLPESRIDVFTTSADTAALFQSLTQDWRFSRVRITVCDGAIHNAITRYAAEKSPDVLIIETHQIDKAFTTHLESLANVCSTHTAAVFIGPENDITLYRRLLEMGATDYLVQPLKRDDVVDVLSKTLLDRLGASSSRITAFLGAKGGVGTSRMAQLTAHALAGADTPVTLLDCGGSWGIHAMTYGRDPLATLRDLATLARTQGDTLDDVIHKISDTMSLVGVGGDAYLAHTLTSDGFEGIIDNLCKRHPHVIVDLSQSATGIRAMALAKSHDIVLVTNATPISLRNTRGLIREIHNMRGPEGPLHVIVNETGLLPREELNAADIHEALGIKPCVTLEFQPDSFATLDTADPAPAIKLLNNMAYTVSPLVEAITGKRLGTASRTRDSTEKGQNPSLSLWRRLLS